MQEPLSAEELAKLYPHLTPAQRSEQERWHRGRIHALMQGQPTPSAPQPWPETPDAIA